jgi:hypothetical protein
MKVKKQGYADLAEFLEGLAGQEKTKTSGSAELCEKEAEKLVAEKPKKGYVPEDREGDGPEAVGPTGEAKMMNCKSTGSGCLTCQKKRTPTAEADKFFKKYGKRPPVALKKLLEFESEFGDDYTHDFKLKFKDESSMKSWFSEKGFSDSFIVFAEAGYSDNYAFWIVDDDLETCPIAVLENGGKGVHVVATNILQFIRLLTYDGEISIGEYGAYFTEPEYDDEDDEEDDEDGDDDEEDTRCESPDRPEFLKWAKENFDLDPIKTDDEAMVIVNRAKKKHQKDKALLEAIKCQDWNTAKLLLEN